MAVAVTAQDGSWFEWNGADDNGVPLRAGVFFYRVRVNGRLIGAERSVLIR
jgi:hypothetical protein